MAGKFVLKKSKNEKFYFSLVASNGQGILSSEMYESRASALKGIESVKANSSQEGRYERLNGKDGSPYFTLKASNGQVIGNSEMYSSAASRDNGITSCMSNGPAASTDDQT